MKATKNSYFTLQIKDAAFFPPSLIHTEITHRELKQANLNNINRDPDKCSFLSILKVCLINIDPEVFLPGDHIQLFISGSDFRVEETWILACVSMVCVS